MFQNDDASVHKTNMADVGLKGEENAGYWVLTLTTLNTFRMNWNTDCTLDLHTPTSVANIIIAFAAEWTQLSAATLQNLVENLPKTSNGYFNRKGGKCLEWDVYQAHKYETVQCPQTFVYIV